jgi:Concanavalin A-like lectin/glucanases superfamily
VRHPFLRTLAGSAAPAATDPNFENVTLLLHGDGTNGGQNNTFVDGSTNNFTITRNGNTTQGTFSPYGDNWSNYFDGTGDDLSLTGQSLAATDWTVECWVNFQSFSNNAPHLWNFGSDINNRYNVFRNSTTGTFSFTRVNGGSYDIKNGTTVPVVGRWYHVAVVRVNSTGVQTLYVDGVAEVTNTGSISTGTTWTIGFVPGGATADRMLGYISNLRVVTSAVYTSTFTPPTAPLAAITNTSLLTCQSNRFRDASTNNRAITRNGDVSVQRFSPFSPTAAYATGTIGGSGYFDGSGDYLGVPSGAFSYASGTAYTVEVWVYPTSYPTQYPQIFGPAVSAGSNTASMYIQNNGAVGFGQAGVGAFYTAAAGTIGLNRWNHIAVGKNSSNSGRMWVNGVSVATATDTANYAVGATIVGQNPAGTERFAGYICDLRSVTGSDVYGSANTTITVPTAPLSSVTNTQLRLAFQNAAILDNAMMAVPETVGNAQIDTTIKKFGTGSLKFDGTGDWLRVQGTPNLFNLSTGDFTIECWFYGVSTGTSAIVQQGTTDWRISYTNSGVMRYEVGANSIQTSTGAFSFNTWTHLAICKSGATTTLYLDGTSRVTTTNSPTNSGNPVYVGANIDGGSPFWPLNGYIDDLRITKGVARYTANFTPPTAAFPDL